MKLGQLQQSFMAALVLLAGTSAAFSATFHATGVESFSPALGDPARDPAFSDTSLALGGPEGTGDSGGSRDVFNLGNGGSITLSFNDGPTPRAITDGPGKDFIVFENAFLASSTRSFTELMLVDVSSDGTHWARFPVTSTTPAQTGIPEGLMWPILMSNVSGFAGVHPVYANTDLVDGNSIDPFDPATAGGDAFDLADLTGEQAVKDGLVDLLSIRYLRLTDVIGDGSLLDKNGNPIYDPTGSNITGADVDAVSVINGVVVPEPAAIGMVLAAAGLLVLRRRRR